MGNKPLDVIVIGLGAMGSAAIYQLSKSGAKVLGIDRYAPPHNMGSTYGDTRITRLAVGEGSEYVPLVKRSHQIWRELEAESGYELLNQCGYVYIAPRGVADIHHGESNFFDHMAKFAEEHDIKHSILDAEQLEAKFPQFGIEGNEQAYYEPEGGYLRPENCLNAQLELAKKHGAQLNMNEEVLSYTPTADRVMVTTDKGTYTAAKLIIAAGPWISELLPEYKENFQIYRQVLYWFDLKNKDDYPAWNKLPTYARAIGDKAEDSMYGFPAIDGPEGGVKVATEQYEATTTPNNIDRTIGPDEINHMYEKHLKKQFPGLSSNCLRAWACMYTTTPDHKFVIDFHPQYDNVIVASPCSGHGFKHSAAIGEVLAQLATGGKSDIDISKFSFARL